MEDLKYLIGGIVVSSFGLYVAIRQFQKWQFEKIDKYGSDIKLFGGGLMFIMLGLALVIRYFTGTH